MPGILGVVDATAPPGANQALARAIAARLRVQPGLRVEVDTAAPPTAVLGRVHLGIFDGDAAPAASPDGACRLVLSGEVASFPGAAALLAAYLERGDAALRGLTGSFALALWDGRARRLLLANDRFGLRNVFFHTQGTRRLLFAPQVGALLADRSIARRLDAQAAAEFLAFQCVLLDRTLVEEVRLLPPASLLVFQPGRAFRIESTWHLRYRADARSASPREHAHALAGALRDAVTRAADGGRRVGLPLSGGLDSRTLLAAVPRERTLPTLTYGRIHSDDVRLAAELAGLAGAPHHLIPLPAGYMAEEARTMVERTDGMHSCLNGHAARLREAASACDIIVLGNGGDCLLDGLWNGAETTPEPDFLAWLLGRLEIGLPRSLASAVVAPTAPFADFSARIAAGLAHGFAAAGGDRLADRADVFNVVHRHRRWVLQGVPAQATHVEFRHPYYDERVVEVALGVPPALREKRVAHADALGVLSPELARVRRQGMPFGFAVPSWRARLHRTTDRVRDAVRWRANRAGLNPFLARPDRRAFVDYNDELRCGSRALLDDVLLSPRTLGRGWWRPEGLRRVVADHVAGRANHAHALGVVLTLELFVRDVLEPAAAA